MAGLLYATQALAAPASVPMEDFKLSNGMRVILLQDTRVPAVSHNLLFSLGAADDPRGQSGLAHYLEHMLFQGTDNHASGDYSKIIAAQGGETNAFTSADYTGYWVNIAKEQLPLVMDLEADRLVNLSPPPKDFAREKKVILEERRMRVDNSPNALFDEQMNAALYLHYPYGTPIIGWPKEMEALSRETMLDYYTRFYHPGNAVLVISGDLPLGEMHKMVEQHYGSLKSRGEPVPARVEEPEQLAPRHIVMHHKQVKEPQWQKTYLAPSYGWKRDDGVILPLMVVEYLLGGSKTSRLYQRLVEKEGIAQDVSVSYDPYRKGPGEFSIGVTPRGEADVPRIEKEIAEEMARLKATPPSPEELAQAKTQLVAGSIYVRDGLQPLAQVIGHMVMIGLSPQDFFKFPDQVQAVKAGPVAGSIGALDERASVTGLLLP